MQAGDDEGLGNPRAKGFPLELVHPHRDAYGTGHKRAGPLWPHHLQVVVDHVEGSAQENMLVALLLKDPLHLGEFRDQPGGDALSLQPLGCRSSELGLEGANPLMCLIVLSDGLVTLPAGRATL